MVAEALSRLQDRFRLAMVTSSAIVRLSTCLLATGLDRFFSPESRFSAEDSLESPDQQT